MNTRNLVDDTACTAAKTCLRIISFTLARERRFCYDVSLLFLAMSRGQSDFLFFFPFLPPLRMYILLLPDDSESQFAVVGLRNGGTFLLGILSILEALLHFSFFIEFFFVQAD